MFASRGRIRVALALCSVLSLGAVGTWALFTDNAAFTTTFSTGSVDIALTDYNEGKPEPYAFTAWSSTAMKPGDVVYAQLTVHNKGTLPFTYVMNPPTLATTDSAALANQIQVGVRTGGTCDEAGWNAATVVVAQGSLAAAQITTPRPLANGANEILCFRAELPMSADNTSQDLDVHPVFNLLATQATD